MYCSVVIKGENMQISVDCNNCDAIFHKNIEKIYEHDAVEVSCPFCESVMTIHIGEDDE